MRRARSGNLTALLVAVAVLEFIVNRLAGRLFFPRPALTSGGWRTTTHAVSVAGPFLFQLTAILALAVMAAAFAGLFRRGELYPRAMRFSTIVIALFFAALSRAGRCSAATSCRSISSISRSASRSWPLLTGVAFALAKAPRAAEDRRGAVRAARARCTRSASSRRAWRRGSRRLAAMRRALSQAAPALMGAGEVALLLGGHAGAAAAAAAPVSRAALAAAARRRRGADRGVRRSRWCGAST